MKKFILFSLLICTFLSCKDDENSLPDVVGELKPCEYNPNGDPEEGVVDDNENTIMNTCFENRITDVEELKTSLIGTWQLIGHGNGWFPQAKPCASMLFTSEELQYTYVDSRTDTTVSMTYNVLLNSSGTSAYVEFESSLPGLQVGIYCDQYIYGNATPVDGNMYLYQRVD